MADERMRSAKIVLAQFGGGCLAAGLIVGGVAGWYFSNPLSNKIIALYYDSMPWKPTIRTDIVIEFKDPMLSVRHNMTAQDVLNRVLSGSEATLAVVTSDARVSQNPDGAAFTTLQSGSCIVSYAYGQGANPWAKILYRTDREWGQGYVRVSQTSAIAPDRACQARMAN